MNPTKRQAKPTTRGQGRQVIAMALFVGMFVSVGLFRVYGRYEAFREGCVQSRSRYKNDILTRQSSRNQADLKVLTSDKRLRERGEALGMARPTHDQIVEVPKSARSVAASTVAPRPSTGAAN